jgi:hypothetical protein
MAQTGAACERINYDPLVMSDEIAATIEQMLTTRITAAT